MSRQTRDAVVTLIAGLAAIVGELLRSGNDYAAAVAVIAMVLAALAYRYLDAKTLEAIAPDDADELKPILRRVGRAIRRRAGRSEK